MRHSNWQRSIRSKRERIDHTINSDIIKQSTNTIQNLLFILFHSHMAVPVHIGSNIHKLVSEAQAFQFYWMNMRYKTDIDCRCGMCLPYYLFGERYTVCSCSCLLMVCSVCISHLIVDIRIDATDVMDGDARNKCHGNADYCKDISGYLSVHAHTFSAI